MLIIFFFLVFHMIQTLIQSETTKKRNSNTSSSYMHILPWPNFCFINFWNMVYTTHSRSFKRPMQKKLLIIINDKKESGTNKLQKEWAALKNKTRNTIHLVTISSPTANN
jgi:hypothetical protein